MLKILSFERKTPEQEFSCLPLGNAFATSFKIFMYCLNTYFEFEKKIIIFKLLLLLLNLHCGNT